jgi:HPr kinase/phosphorylase
VSTSLTVGRFYDRMHELLQLEQITDGYGLDRPITSSEAHSPGLVLAGYTERFTGTRIQVLGETEISYLLSLSHDERLTNLGRYFAVSFPCLIVTKGQELPDGLLEHAMCAGVPVLRTALKTAEFYRRLKPFLEDEFAPTTTLHGSLADVFGVGLFFTGQSGIGKSECVLDLVERGHRLVADDLVLCRRRGTDVVVGRGHELQRHHMEIRGVGLVDVPGIFGIRAVRQQKRIEVVVHLEPWDQDAVVERTGLDGETTTVLGVELPRIRVPLNPGKNITVIGEVIAMNHLLRYSGVDTAEAFNQRLIVRMRQAADVRRYLQEDDE